jgi:hypothetical protein
VAETEIIETCEAIEKRRFNPFFLDVELAIRTIRAYYPAWEKKDDVMLDAEVVQNLSKVLMLQNTQLLFQSSKLYGDPEIIQDKIKRFTARDLAYLMLSSMHPAVELEQLTLASIKQGLDYWRHLKPFAERIRRKIAMRGKNPKKIDLKELVHSGVLQIEDFASFLQKILLELNKECGSNGFVDYWRFIKRGDFSTTVDRAQAVSFLVSYGMVEMRTKDRIGLRPRTAPIERRRQASFPIAINEGK